MPPESPPRSVADRVALALATVFGVGLAPIVPGTFGSLPALPLAWLLGRLGGAPAVLAAAAAVAVVGVWAAGRAARLYAAKDPRRVVIDEVAGQLVTVSLVPPGLRSLALGFVVFRILDIWKPYPADRLESLPGGSGIMADDLMAGLYGAALLWATSWIFPGLLGGP